MKNNLKAFADNLEDYFRGRFGLRSYEINTKRELTGGVFYVSSYISLDSSSVTGTMDLYEARFYVKGGELVTEMIEFPVLNYKSQSETSGLTLKEAEATIKRELEDESVDVIFENL